MFYHVNIDNINNNNNVDSINSINCTEYEYDVKEACTEYSVPTARSDQTGAPPTNVHVHVPVHVVCCALRAASTSLGFILQNSPRRLRTPYNHNHTRDHFLLLSSNRPAISTVSCTSPRDRFPARLPSHDCSDRPLLHSMP